MKIYSPRECIVGLKRRLLSNYMRVRTCGRGSSSFWNIARVVTGGTCEEEALIWGLCVSGGSGVDKHGGGGRSVGNEIIQRKHRRRSYNSLSLLHTLAHHSN